MAAVTEATVALTKASQDYAKIMPEGGPPEGIEVKDEEFLCGRARTPKSHTPASRATLCNLLRLYMAIFKGLASPTANPGTAECCS